MGERTDIENLQRKVEDLQDQQEPRRRSAAQIAQENPLKTLAATVAASMLTTGGALEGLDPFGHQRAAVAAEQERAVTQQHIEHLGEVLAQARADIVAQRERHERTIESFQRREAELLRQLGTTPLPSIEGLATRSIDEPELEDAETLPAVSASPPVAVEIE